MLEARTANKRSFKGKTVGYARAFRSVFHPIDDQHWSCNVHADWLCRRQRRIDEYGLQPFLR